MKRFSILIALLFTYMCTLAQIVKIEPATATGDDEIKVIYDATSGTAGLVGASKVYMHSGIITDGPNGTSWSNVIGNWGADDGVGEMTKVTGEDNLWEIVLSPSAKEYYNAADEDNIFRLAMVFRNADGSAEGKGTAGTFDGGEVISNGDILIDLVVSNFVTIQKPTRNDLFVEDGEVIQISAEASSDVAAMALMLDQGNGFQELASVNSGKTIRFDFTPSESFEGTLKVTATVNGEQVEDQQEFNVILAGSTQEAALPGGVKKGINYVSDPTKVVLVLEAPGKDFVYVVGDFNDWQIKKEFLMNRTPDGELFWLEISDLEKGKEYVFQYWVEGNIKIGDPYADKIADPWNDKFIPSGVHNAIPTYDKTEYAIASTLQTDQESFQWAVSEDIWERPQKESLVVYELLVRDFIESHDYKDLTDTLSYLKRLGVNAIQLMPIMEFEGNESWGYNPMYFFAPDKYYGSKSDLKAFIQACHQQGMAVILDMVLNHAFGLNPMVRMYWDEANEKPAADNPWFNTDATHPFNVGFDFNHESAYTKNFVDSVNQYWIEEYHFDGYRFDLSKGFTQTNNPDDVRAWSARDDTRITLLKRMADKIWEVDNKAYVILEHFADAEEENILAQEGMLLWRNMGFSYHEALGGATSNSFSGASVDTHVSYMESHDEQRQLWEVYQNGRSNGAYETKDTTLALERLKSNAAFLYMLPGPKMLWQFGELGYDIDINLNGRTGNKPQVWGNGSLGYYSDELRQNVYQAFAQILNLRQQVHQQAGVEYEFDLGGEIRSILIDSDDLDVLVVGNFSMEDQTTNVDFTATGSWYNYFSGEEKTVDEVTQNLDLRKGEFIIFTNQKISDGFPGVVEAYEMPVTISPAEFGANTEIRIVFDATKAHPAGTDGLEGANKVYLHSGVVFNDIKSKKLENVVGTFTDDGLGEMTKVAGESDLWEITLQPADYYEITSGEPVRLGMFFRDADNTHQGKGFRGQTLFFNMELNGELITISPESFDQDTEITLTFDARFGDRGLVGAGQVYMHSGLALTENGTIFSEGTVVGEWGADNGVGQMSRTPENNDQWQITFTPATYYGLDDSTVAYRLAMVFRNADGSRKGAGIPGKYDWGEVIGNGDIFFDIPVIKQVTSIADELPYFSYYPNPTQGLVQFSGEIPGRIQSVKLFDIAGNEVLEHPILNGNLSPMDVSGLSSGIYLLRIATTKGKFTLKLMVR